MVYHKTETEANGHDVTIQQVRGPDSDMGESEVGLWINGNAVKMGDDYNTQSVPEEFYPNDTYDVSDVKRFAAFLVDNDSVICAKCHEMMDIGTGSRIGFCDVKCDECTTNDQTCSDGGDHSWNCTNPRQKHNARIATRYKCEKCGKTKKTTPTG